MLIKKDSFYTLKVYFERDQILKMYLSTKKDLWKRLRECAIIKCDRTNQQNIFDK